MAIRELSVIYGSTTVGGTSTDFLLDGYTRKFRSSDGPSYVEFDVVVSASSPSGLADKCTAMEQVFRTPRLDLAVIQSGVTLVQASHSTATGGFNTEPEIRKIGDVGDSGRSRRYTIRIAYEVPSDQVAVAGLRESTVDVSADAAGILTVAISGLFTGIAGTPSSRARYDAAIAAYVTTQKTALGITTWELVEIPTSEHDYDDRTLRFRRVYRELIFGQGQDAANDDEDIADQTLTVTRREFSEERSTVVSQGGAPGGVGGSSGSASGPEQAPSSNTQVQSSASVSIFDASTGTFHGAFAGSQGGAAPPPPAPESSGGVAGGAPPAAEGATAGTGNVQALAVYDLHYEAHIVKTVTDLKGKYDSLRSWLLSQFSAVFAQGHFALTVEEPRFDRVNNRITVDMVAEGSVSGAAYVRRTVTTESRFTSGVVFRGAWNGDPLAHYLYQGFDTVLKVVTVSARLLSAKDREASIGDNEAQAESFGGAAVGGSGGGITIEKSSSYTPIRIGIEGSGHVLDMVDVVSTVTVRKVHRVGA